jgi:hypothetical protein
MLVLVLLLLLLLLLQDLHGAAEGVRRQAAAHTTPTSPGPHSTPAGEADSVLMISCDHHHFDCTPTGSLVNFPKRAHRPHLPRTSLHPCR